MRTFFTSDPHFWHRNVIEFCQRPFSSVEAMNEGLIVRWNATVDEGDEVWVLGDVAFCGSIELRKIIPRLNGYKRLVMGNHDWKYKPTRWIEFGFADVMTVGSVKAKVPGGVVMLSHFPYHGGGDHMQEERYAEHRLHDKGHWLLHGHVHTGWKKKKNMINVGVDVWDYRPVALETIEELINA